MRLLRFFVRNHYCNKCHEIDQLVKCNMELKRQDHLLQAKAHNYSALVDFNKYNESIVKTQLHNGDPVVVTVQNEYNYKGFISAINLYGYAYQQTRGFQKVQSLFAEIVYTANLPSSIYIIDFRGIMNCGYGSIVMSEFLKYVRSLNISSIYEINGFLSFVDADHWDMLKHFYKKFGFEITEDQHIILKL